MFRAHEGQQKRSLEPGGRMHIEHSMTNRTHYKLERAEGQPFTSFCYGFMTPLDQAASNKSWPQQLLGIPKRASMMGSMH